jgi:hypothetical protein
MSFFTQECNFKSKSDLWPIILLCLVILSPGCSRHEGNVDPSFDTQQVAALRAKMSAAGISELYIIAGNSDAALFAEVDRVILWNHAATQTYGSIDAVRKTGKAGAIEPGVNWPDPFGGLLRTAGIEEGFLESKLYEIWHPKLVTPGRGEGSHRALIHEHWIGDVAGRATVEKSR